MEADVGGGVGGESSSSSLVSRQRFYIELRPGETTIVSWKRLIKDANKEKPCPAALGPSLNAPQTTLECSVDLDEYFQADKSDTKHNEFFVNKGKLEQINEPISPADCQLKKRRKNMMKAPDEKDGNLPDKHPKLGHVRLKAAARIAPLLGKSSSHSQSLAANGDHPYDGKLQHPLNTPIGSSTTKLADSRSKVVYSLFSRTSNKDASGFPVKVKDTEKQRKGITQSSDLGGNVKKASKQLDLQPKILASDTAELEFSNNIWCRDKNGRNELPDLNIAVNDCPIIPVKTSSVHPKDISSARPKGTMLERAIRKLEKVVAESRPPNLEVQDADTSPIATKRRLPPDVKQQLAKVARLAQSSQGKISEELVNHLMSILGHLVQLRTLKRNLREMVFLGLSAKREKADRFQQIKEEVTEMIKFQASKQGDGATDDFREVLGSEEKGVLKGKYKIDNAMEDKMYDLYDLYVQGMDEDKGPQSRKLYAELAELWPTGAMDNHGIKSAICRAKERRRALYGCDRAQEKIRRKNFPTLRTERIACGEASSIALPQDVQERQISDSNVQNLTSSNRMISGLAIVDEHIAAPAGISGPSLKVSEIDPPKQERIQKMAFSMLKEQMKQQQRDMERRVNKLSLNQENESHKSHKRAAAEHPDEVSHQLVTTPSRRQLS